MWHAHTHIHTYTHTQMNIYSTFLCAITMSFAYLTLGLHNLKCSCSNIIHNILLSTLYQKTLLLLNIVFSGLYVYKTTELFYKRWKIQFIYVLLLLLWHSWCILTWNSQLNRLAVTYATYSSLWSVYGGAGEVRI